LLQAGPPVGDGEETKELLCDAVSFLAKYGPAGGPLCVVLGAGGDPLADIDLFLHLRRVTDALGQAVSRRVFLFPTTTCGDVLTGHGLAVLHSAGLRHIAISLDGPPAVQARNRPGTYLRANWQWRELVQLSHKIGIFVSASATFASDAGEVQEIYRFLLDLPFDMVSVRPVRCSPLHECYLDQQRVESALRSLVVFLRELLRRPPRAACDDLCRLSSADMFGRFLDAVVFAQKRSHRCPAGMRHVFLGFDRMVYGCPGFFGSQWCLGNVHNGMDIDACERFNGQKVRARPTCSQCAIRDYCGGPCSANSYLASGDINQADPNECALNRGIAEAAVRFASFIYRERQELYEAYVQTRLQQAQIDSNWYHLDSIPSQIRPF
jgi:radical SAM protein with 4Fe4S-binding SPASM domain